MTIFAPALAIPLASDFDPTYSSQQTTNSEHDIVLQKD
jgi:hypothetical protein